MQEAKIGIFDDLEIFRTRTELILRNLGHNILINAATLRESVKAIDALEDTLDVALVDGTLEHDSEPMSDGKTIARLLREKFGGSVNIVSVSGAGDIFEGADTAIAKADVEAISDFIDQLPDKQKA